MNKKETLIKIVRRIDKEYGRAIWDSDKIFQEFARRSIPEIKQSREINYLCCLERHYLVANNAFLEGIQTTLVMAKIKRPFQKVKLATAVEFESEGINYTYIAAITGDKIIQETYPYRNSQSRVHKLNTDKIDFKKSWFENFAVRNTEGLEFLFPEFDSIHYLDWVVSKNSKQHLQNVLASISRKRVKYPEVYI